MVLRIFKIIATSSFLAAIECTKFAFGRGSAPDPTGGAYSASPLILKGEGREKGKGEGKGRGKEGETPPPPLSQIYGLAPAIAVKRLDYICGNKVKTN